VRGVDKIYPDIFTDERYLSSEHEDENDSIRNIIEENDDIYQEMNELPPVSEIATNPEKIKFIKDF
jgi:hypothetical protein